MTKPDDDVAREREAVQKLIGARGAMETALLRIHRLEQAISTMLVYNDEVAAGIGDGLFVVTFRHNDGSGAKPIRLKDYLLKTSEIGRKVL